jgi:Sulfotransferase domain
MTSQPQSAYSPPINPSNQERMVMAHSRAIDRDQSVTKRPMRVLCLGISRTGTLSLCAALSKLGYKTFHMSESFSQPRRFFPLWIEALDAKFFGKGEQFGKKEFDKILSGYDCVSDLPCALFADEFVEYYPEAKVILTERDPDKWIKSMQQTIYLAHSWSSWDWLKYWDPGLVKLWIDCDKRDWSAFLGETGQPGRQDYLSAEYAALAKKRYVEHYQHIKKIVPKERLLLWKPEDGWEPLVRFLEQGTPVEAFPHVNDAAAFVVMAKQIWWATFGKMVATTVLPIGLAVGGWYWLRRR